MDRGILTIQTKNGHAEFPIEISDEIVEGAGRSYQVMSLTKAIKAICYDFLHVHRTFDSIEIDKIMEHTKAETIIEALCICAKKQIEGR